jgi:hypothetical protein
MPVVAGWSQLCIRVCGRLILLNEPTKALRHLSRNWRRSSPPLTPILPGDTSQRSPGLDNKVTESVVGGTLERRNRQRAETE